MQTTATKRTPAIYGAPPKTLGLHEFDTSEMMFWLYCPIKLPGFHTNTYPENLAKFAELLVLTRRDFIDTYGLERWRQSYVYLSAKTMYVSPGSPGNRLGWHSDGFRTDDVNYIWSDKNPTLFYIRDALTKTYADHEKSLKHFKNSIPWRLENGHDLVKTYPEKTLLRLDQTVIHAVNPEVTPGVRTFLKVSISDKPYALRGNSINHKLDHPAPVEDRQVERNCPRGIAA